MYANFQYGHFEEAGNSLGDALHKVLIGKAELLAQQEVLV